ncbi:flagellar protein FlaG [Thiobacillus denitrificans]|uniref:flagellar protein FlaG n=1 Tax=Thiobacillus denitrificans TaxID=36861 RepID=UPI000B1038AF|nr:flagellar protein FlaG [Thiobacillus denitrificans]
MSIGKVDSVDLAPMRQAPPSAPITPAQRATLDSPVFAPAPPVTQEAIAAAAQSANAYMQSVSSNLQFSLDQDTGHTVVRMIDTETEEVLRQFPSEEMLAISRSIDRMQGLLINREA